MFPRKSLLSIASSMFVLLILQNYSAFGEDLPLEVIVQGGHTTYVDAVALSPDGKYLVTGSQDKTAKLWQVSTGREIKTFSGHSNWVTSIAFTPNGKYVVTGSRDNTAKLWDVTTGKEIRTFADLSERSLGIKSVAITSDGQYLVTGSGSYQKGKVGGGRAILWSIETGREIRRFGGYKQAVGAVAISPDDKYLAAGSEDGRAILWNMFTGEEFRTLSAGDRSTGIYISSATFSPDGKYVLIAGHSSDGSAPGRAELFDVATGTQIGTFYASHPIDRPYAAPPTASFTPDSKHLAVGGGGGTLAKGYYGYVYFWTIDTGEKIQTIQGHSRYITSLAFSPDGKYLVTGSQDKTAILWDRSTDKEIRTFKGHSELRSAVEAVSFSTDGNYIVTGSEDGAVELWNLPTGKRTRTLVAHAKAVSSVAFSPDGKYLVTGSRDATAKLWEVASGRKVRDFAFPSMASTSQVAAVAFSNDGKYTLVANSFGAIKVWDISTGEVIRSIKAYGHGLHDAVFSADGQYIVGAGQVYNRRTEFSATLWEFGTGKPIRTFLHSVMPLTDVFLWLSVTITCIW